jgi:hypothetical protein
MRHFLIILFTLASLSSHCIGAGEQPADGSASTSQPAESSAEDSAGKPQGEKTSGDKKKSAGGEEEEPDCE